jgi:hypothetical protein
VPLSWRKWTIFSSILSVRNWWKALDSDRELINGQFYHLWRPFWVMDTVLPWPYIQLVKISLLCEIFVVERKMIVIDQFKYPLLPLKTGTASVR